MNASPWASAEAPIIVLFKRSRMVGAIAHWGRFKLILYLQAVIIISTSSLRICQICLNTCPRRSIAGRQPGTPNLVHGIAVADVLEPNLGLQKAGFIRVVGFKDLIDLGKCLGRLSLDVLGRVASGAPLEINKAVELTALARILFGSVRMILVMAGPPCNIVGLYGGRG